MKIICSSKGDTWVIDTENPVKSSSGNTNETITEIGWSVYWEIQ